MSERITKYLGALSRRKRPLSLKQIEVLSSDFDVSEQDLKRLSAGTRRFVGTEAILHAPAEDLYAELKDMVYGAYHDKETLLLLAPDLAERYRQDKLKLVYDLLMVVLAQAKQLGANPDELSGYGNLADSKSRSSLIRSLWIAWLILMALLFIGYREGQRGWFSWAGDSAEESPASRHLYLGTVGEDTREEPLGESGQLEPTVAVAGFNDLPLKIGASSVIVFPESYLYDLRAGITIPRPWESFNYTISVKTQEDTEIQSFSGSLTEPVLGAWDAGVTIPFEFQNFELGRPKGTPYSITLSLDEVKTASPTTAKIPRIPLIIQNLSPENLSLSGDLTSLLWKEKFGIHQGEFVLELLHNSSSQVRNLRVNLVVLDAGGNRIASFERDLIEKDHSLSFARGEKRRFALTHDFIKMIVGDLPAKAKTYRLEVLSWQ